MTAGKKAAMLLGIGGLLMAVGSLLEFASVPGQSLSGLDTDDGKLYLGTGIVLAIFAGVIWSVAASMTRRVIGVLATLASLFMLYAAIIDVTDIPEGVSVGIGLYIVLVGTILASVGSIWSLAAKSDAGAPMAPPPPPAA